MGLRPRWRVESDPVRSGEAMAARALRLLTILLAVAAAACRAEVETEAGWDIAAPDLLFAEGTAAYARGDWAGVVLSMERALRSRAALRALRLRCRTRCAADLPWELDPDSPPSLAQASGAALYDLRFFGGLLRRAACLRRCLGPPAAHSLSEELELEFRKRSPYNYLQVAYFKVQTCPGSRRPGIAGCGCRHPGGTSKVREVSAEREGGLLAGELSQGSGRTRTLLGDLPRAVCTGRRMVTRGLAWG